MEKTKNTKKLVVIIAIVLVAVLAIAAGVYFILTAEKVTFYEPKVELGDEKYLEQLIANVYVKEGYEFEVKDNKIDINTAGTYTLTLEVKGKGKTTEEVKEIQVVDTTPPTIELTKTEFYIGDTVNLAEVVRIKDLSANKIIPGSLDKEKEIPYEEAKVLAEGSFDTTKSGKSTIKVSATDRNGNVGTAELTIDVKDPIVTVYDYLIGKINGKSMWNFSNGSYDDNFVVKYSTKSSGITMSGWVNFTQKAYYDYSYYIMSLAELTYFDKNDKVTKLYINNKRTTKKSDIKDAQESLDLMLRSIYNHLDISSDKVNLTGKTITQLKNETIDLRTLEK